MKTVVILFVLHVCWSSVAGETSCDQNKCTQWMDPDAKLTYTNETQFCEIEAMLMLNYTDKRATLVTINAKSICCSPSETQGDDTPTKDVSTTATIQTDTMDTVITTQSTNKRQAANCFTTSESIGMGIVVGLLVVLLAVVTTGWMWTCWMMKKHGRIIINSRDISNPSYGDKQPSPQPPPTAAPTYETIPPLNHLMDGIKLELVEPEEVRCNVSNSGGEGYHKVNRGQMDNKKRESRGRAHKSRQMKGHRGEERVTESNGNNDLQEIDHSSFITSTELILEPSKKERSDGLVETGKSSQENESTNSSVKKNDKESYGTISEQDGYQMEDGEKEQDLLKKRPTPRGYEVAVPSK